MSNKKTFEFVSPIGDGLKNRELVSIDFQLETGELEVLISDIKKMLHNGLGRDQNDKSKGVLFEFLGFLNKGIPMKMSRD